MYTNNYGLYYTQSGDNPTFQQWRNEVAGSAGNMQKIDTALQDMADGSPADVYYNIITQKLMLRKADGTYIGSGATIEAGVSELAMQVEEIDGAYYLVTYKDEDMENELCRVLLPATGGGGGGSSLEYAITLRNLLENRTFSIAEGGDAVLEFSYTSEDEDGGNDGNGIGSILVNNVKVASIPIAQGNNSINVAQYLSVGDSSVKVRVENSEGSFKTLTYTITVETLGMTTTFQPMQIYSGAVSFSYTVVGSGTKTVKFLMDGTQIGSVQVTTTGRSQTYTIPQQTHGAHTFTAYAEKEINGQTVQTQPIILNMIWIEEGNMTPAISIRTDASEITQGDTITAEYMIYDPSTELSNATLSILMESGTVYSTRSLTGLDRTVHTWTTQDYPAGTITLRITSGEGSAQTTVTVEEFDLPVDIVTEGLVMEFSADGRSNAEEDPAQWSYEDYEATFTGFGWSNADGWMSDSAEGTCLRFLPDDFMTIPVMPFASDLRDTGYTIEAEFATRDVRDYDSVVISCVDGGRGFSIKTQQATLTSEQSSVSMQFKEDSRVRVAFVVENRNLNRFIYIYINGVMCGVQQYPALDNFAQVSPVGFTIGAETCGLDLYRIRCYSRDLSRREQLDNYIVDRPTLAGRQDAVYRNDVLNESEEVSIAKLPPNLPYMVIASTALPTDKNADDITNCTVTFVDQEDPANSFVATKVKMAVQGTSSAGYPVKNFKVKLLKDTGATLTVNGVEKTDGYQIRPGMMPVKTLCLKADYASSEGANNVELVDLYEKACPYRTPPQQQDSRVRQGIAGRPIVLFWQNTNTNEVTFVGKYNENWDKSNPEAFGFNSSYPNAECWEFLDNSVDLCLFKTGNMSNWQNAFEARQPDGGTDVTRLTRVVQWVASTRRDTATDEPLEEAVEYDGVTYDSDTAAYRLAKFRAEFEDYFVLDSSLFYYLFTEVFLMVDSRAKNAFITTYDGVHWCWLPYDMDTAIGINNEGNLAFDYNLEDTDLYNGGVVFNGQESVMWNNLRDAFGSELKAMYNTLRGGNLFNYEYVRGAFLAHQSVWPEAVWNEDAFIKYLQPYLLQGVDNLEMLQGSKESQRDWWLYNGFRYRDSKYQSGDANNYIQLRAFEKAPITVVPYSHIYAKAEFGNERIDMERATKGQAVTLSDPSDDPWAAGTDTVVRIYSADRLSSVGDLSALNAGTADFSAAVKLQSLKLGDDDDEYENTHLTSLTVGNNELLTELDIQNCVNLTQTVNLSGCPSLETVLAGGSAITGVSLFDGGHLKELYLPDTITNLTVKNQKLFDTLSVAGYDNLSTLWVENTPNIPLRDIINGAENLNRVRIINMSWEEDSAEDLADTIAVLENCIGMDATGANTEHAVVNGSVEVPSITPELLEEISDSFPELTVYVNGEAQLIVTYVNWDSTVLYKTTVAEGGDAVNPVTEGLIDAPTRQNTDEIHYTFRDFGTLPENITQNKTVVAQYDISYRVRYYNESVLLSTIYVLSGGTAVYDGSTPTKASTAQYSYAFNGWVGSQTNVTSARDITAQFTATVRTYDVKFYNGSTLLQTVSNVAYGGSAVYTGTTPIKPGETDDTDFEFNGWDPSPNNITGATNCYAQYRDKRSVTVRYLSGLTDEFESETLTSVTGYAFYGMTSLTSFSAPVTTIANYAFYGCTNLTVVDCTGESAVSIGGSSVFTNCNNLQHLIIRSASVSALSNTTYLPPQIQNENGAIYVPAELVDIYKSATNWSAFKKQIFPIESYPITNFDFSIQDSWATIQANCEAGNTDGYEIGDYKNVDMGSYGTIKFEIIAKDLDILTDENGAATTETAALTWLAIPFVTTHVMNSTNTNANGWPSTAMRSWLRSDVLTAMPEELQAAIKPVYKTYYNKTTSSTLGIEDTIWIPSAREMFGGTSYEGSGVNYTNKFNSSTNRIKKNTSGTASSWWLRSAYSFTSRDFCSISITGAVDDIYASYAYGVVPGFCT